MGIIEGVYDINVTRDTEAFERDQVERFRATVYPIAIEGHRRVTSVPELTMFTIQVPAGISMYDVIADADDAWMDSDNEDAPKWLVNQALAAVAEETVPGCPRHGGDWGDDVTCPMCTTPDGDPKDLI